MITTTSDFSFLNIYIVSNYEYEHTHKKRLYVWKFEKLQFDWFLACRIVDANKHVFCWSFHQSPKIFGLAQWSYSVIYGVQSSKWIRCRVCRPVASSSPRCELIFGVWLQGSSSGKYAWYSFLTKSNNYLIIMEHLTDSEDE